LRGIKVLKAPPRIAGPLDRHGDLAATCAIL
jgi:hypothetical protein